MGDITALLFTKIILKINKERRRWKALKRLKPVTDEEWALCNELNRALYDDFFDNNIELSDATRRVYKSCLKIWINYIRTNLNNKDYTKIRSVDYKRFQNWLVSLNHSSSDIGTKRSCISSFNDYIMVYYEDEYPTFRNFINSSIKKPEKSFVNTKQPPTHEELMNMITKLREEKPRNYLQYIAYLAVTYDTGCRRAETRQLRKEIAYQKPIKKTVIVTDENGNKVEKTAKYYKTGDIRCKGRGKTGKVRQFKISEWAMDAIREWLDFRGDDDCPYIFVNKQKDGTTRQLKMTTFNDWSENVFTPLLGRRFHPHCLREARATDIVVRQGKSLEVAQSLLGHNSTETTKIYVIDDSEDEDSDELFI